MNEQQMLMQLLGMQHEGAHGGGGGVSFEDPTGVDFGALFPGLQLSPEEVQTLQVRAPDEGPSLRQRLEALRPGLRLPGGEVNLTGEGIEGRITW